MNNEEIKEINEVTPSLTYPAERELTGIYFRVQRNGKWVNVDFTDMTKEEQESVLTGKDSTFLINMCSLLANRVYYLGELFDIKAADD